MVFFQNLIFLFMDYILLPYTDFKVSRLAFGAWPIAGGFNWGPQDDKDSRATLRVAYEEGINFFDTAKGYGDGKSEELINKELGDVRGKIFIANKVSPDELTYPLIKEACHDRLRAMNTDYIDLLQIHWPNWDVPLEETFRGLEELKQEGKVRAYGVSNFGKKDLGDSIALGAKLSGNQLPYNLLWRSIEFEITPLCETHNVPVLCYMPILQGMLSGKFSSADEIPEDRARTRHFSSQRPLTRHKEPGCEELTFDTIKKIKQLAADLGVPMADLSMAWLLAQPIVGCILVGARNVDQIKQNINANQIKLAEDVIQKLNEITKPLKQELGKNPDLWQSGKDTRYR
jgi:myo-inositol catabolism protein IolS